MPAPLATTFYAWREAVRSRRRADGWIECSYERAERVGSVVTFGWPLF